MGVMGTFARPHKPTACRVSFTRQQFGHFWAKRPNFLLPFLPCFWPNSSNSILALIIGLQFQISPSVTPHLIVQVQFNQLKLFSYYLQ